MAATSTFGVKGVNGAAFEGGNRGFDKAGLVERVRVQPNLHVIAVGHRKAAINGGGCRAPILMELKAAGASEDLFLKRCGQRGIALAHEAKVHGESICRFNHAGQMPRARRASRGFRSRRGTCAAANHCRNAGVQSLLNLLGCYEMNMGVDATCREDFSFSGNNLCAWANNDGDARLRIGITGLADGSNAAVFQTHISFHNAPVIDDQGIGDHRINRTRSTSDLALTHAIPDNLAAAEGYFFTMDGEVAFHFNEKLGIREPYLVAHRGSKHGGITGAWLSGRHHRSPMIFCWKP